MPVGKRVLAARRIRQPFVISLVNEFSTLARFRGALDGLVGANRHVLDVIPGECERQRA
jgi:hypothetical protein